MTEAVSPSLRWWLTHALVALLGSCLLASASPPRSLAPLVWLGFAPASYVARQCARTTRGWRGPMALGTFGALGVGLGGFPWIATTIARFAELPMVLAGVALLLFSLWTALAYGVWMVIVARGPQRGVLGTALPVLAWVPLSAWWPSLFPYTPVIGLAQTPEWIQLAELGGVGAVEAAVVMTGVLLADGFDRAGGSARFARWGLALCLPLGLMGAGAWRMASLATEDVGAPTVRFGLVQPNVPLAWGHPERNLQRLQHGSAALAQEGAEVIVWPEAGAYPYLIGRPFDFDRTGQLQVLKHHHVPTVFGVATRDRFEAYDYNSAVAMGGDGRVLGIYDKISLVPFGERIPIVDPEWAQSWIPAMSHNLEGEGPARFVIPLGSGRHVTLGPLICYEDIFADLAREVARQPGGVEVFVNLTIDTWFGDSAASWEHLALAQFRSVEHRIPMVRAVAAGSSSVVDAQGRVVAALGVTDPRSNAVPPPERLLVDVPIARNTADDPSFYARIGWLWTPLCALLAVLIGVLGGRRNKGIHTASSSTMRSGARTSASRAEPQGTGAGRA